jgi:hypothetical protein
MFRLSVTCGICLLIGVMFITGVHADSPPISANISSEELVNQSQEMNESVTGNQTPDNQEVNGSASSVSPEYASLGDIIKAKDWKALGEYSCKIKAENPGLYTEPETNEEEKLSRWDSYFNPPAPVVSTPCCG